MKYIDSEILEKMCHPIAMAIFDKEDDPIAEFSEHELGLLDSALNNPKQTFDGKELYSTLTKKAAILYYGLNKNHPFKNGNKRIATATLMVFLFINDYWLKGDPQAIEDYFVELAKRVASIPGNTDRDLILNDLEKWLEDHTARS
ncbi:MAG: type II toxin-antitoxin system death-on-curing family toxin [Patescibacteria group bacterium]